MELLRQLQVAYPDLEAQGLALALRGCKADFLKPLRFGQWFRLQATLENLQVNGFTVQPWGREYRIAQTGLPESIFSKNEQLLSSPVTFLVGNEILPATAHCRFVSVSNASCRWVADGIWSGMGYHCEGLAEFDGMMRFDVTFTPNGPTQLERLFLQVPVAKEHASLLHFYPLLFDWPHVTFMFQHDSINSTGRPARWQCRFTPLVWLGDEERGLQWFCESGEGWQPEDTEAALEITENDSEALLTIHLLDSPTVLEKPFSLTFGLMAGPVKPAPPTETRRVPL